MKPRKLQGYERNQLWQVYGYKMQQLHRLEYQLSRMYHQPRIDHQQWRIDQMQDELVSLRQWLGLPPLKPGP